MYWTFRGFLQSTVEGPLVLLQRFVCKTIQLSPGAEITLITANTLAALRNSEKYRLSFSSNLSKVRQLIFSQVQPRRNDSNIQKVEDHESLTDSLQHRACVRGPIPPHRVMSFRAWNS